MLTAPVIWNHRPLSMVYGTLQFGKCNIGLGTVPLWYASHENIHNFRLNVWSILMIMRLLERLHWDSTGMYVSHRSPNCASSKPSACWNHRVCMLAKRKSGRSFSAALPAYLTLQLGKISLHQEPNFKCMSCNSDQWIWTGRGYLYITGYCRRTGWLGRSKWQECSMGPIVLPHWLR